MTLEVNMSDLISRQDVLDALRNLAYKHTFQCGEYYGEDERQLTIINAGKAIDVIEAMPSAEPETVKVKMETGFWIPVDSETVNGRCSLCGYESHLYENDVYGEHYCPNCGADMRGDRCMKF
jgi:predicted RNA-binding Zn-ribbon protein involved in translation (DUF1610 family)